MNEDIAACPCCLCMLDGIWSEPIRNWPGFPICREHMAETLVRTSGHPVINPSPGLGTVPATLQ
jgi:hypothetical protein